MFSAIMVYSISLVVFLLFLKYSTLSYVSLIPSPYSGCQWQWLQRFVRLTHLYMVLCVCSKSCEFICVCLDTWWGSVGYWHNS